MLETSALQDMGFASQVVEECHQMGVAFALDDFGTGLRHSPRIYWLYSYIFSSYFVTLANESAGNHSWGLCTQPHRRTSTSNPQ